MAETLVLAELSIDSSGVVSGVAVAGGSLDALGNKTRKVAKDATDASGHMDLLTKRMFNLRTAAVALVGSFSIAGVVFGIKALVGEIIAGDAAFGSFKKSAEGVTNEFGRLVRETFNVRGGLESVTGEMDRLTGLMRLASETGATNAAQGVLGKMLYGAPGVGPILTGLKAAKDLFDQMTEGLRREVEEERKAFDPKRVEDWEAAVKKALAALPGDEGSKPLGTIGPGFRLIEGQIIPKAERLPDILEPATQTFEDWGTLFVGFENSFSDIGENIQEWDITGKTEEIKQMSEASQLAADAIVAIGQSITQHILQGGLTFKAVFADMLMAMVPVLLGLAAIHFLEYDFAGAAYAFAAAIAVAVAAKALGAGATKDYSGGNAGAAVAGSGSTTNLQVTFAGPTFGFNEAAFADYLANLRRRGDRGNR